MLNSDFTRDGVTVYKKTVHPRKLFLKKENVFYLLSFFSPQIFLQSVDRLETPNLVVLIFS